MNIERAILQRARTHVLAEKARAMVRHEAGKGCRPAICADPVALEPHFQPLYHLRPVAVAEPTIDTVPEPPGRDDHLVRLRVWIPADYTADWRRAERFLKQLAAVTCRVGYEIVGNCDQVSVRFLCHERDVPVIAAAFFGEFVRCELTRESQDMLGEFSTDAWAAGALADYVPPPPYSHLLTRLSELQATPFEPFLTAIASLPSTTMAICQVMFQPVRPEHNWHQNIEALLDLEYAVKMFDGGAVPQRYPQQGPSGALQHMAGEVESKAHNDKPLFAAALRVAVVGANGHGPALLRLLTTFTHLFQHGGRPLAQLTEEDYSAALAGEQIQQLFTHGRTYRPGFLLNSWELAGLVHLPPANILEHRTIRLETLDTLPDPCERLAMGTKIGTRRHAGREHPIHIPDDERKCHTHVVGRSSMGKSVLLNHMILQDIAGGAGVAVIDPHGDLVDRLLDLLPESVIERTIYFNPGDPDWVPLWNPLSLVPGQDPARVADDLVAGFKSFVTGWGDRLERFLRESFFALLHLPGSTLLDVSTVLSSQSDRSKDLREKILQVIDGDEPRNFWNHDFKQYRKDDLGPPKNKLSKLLVGGPVALILSQPDCAFNFRQIMDDGMILLVDLSTVGPDVRGVLGCLILSLVYLAALSRSNTPIDQRRQFHLFCDEAHKFMTDALEDLIAETRKYSVSLTLAHQYLSQFNKCQADALSSTGSTIIFNVDRNDAGRLTKDLRGLVSPDDLITLRKFEAIVRARTEIVRINTPEYRPVTGESYRDRIIAESRRRYYKRADEVRRALRSRAQPNNQFRIPAALNVDVGSGEELTYEEL